MSDTRLAADAFVLGASKPGTYYAPVVPRAPHAPRRPGPRRLIVGAAALIIGAVGGFLAWNLLSSGFPFPDEIAGVHRTESEFVDRTIENIRATAETQGVGQLDIAVYGSPVAPKYLMFAFEMPDPAELASLADSGLPQAAAVTDPSGAQTGCADVPDGASCGWVYDDRVVVLAATDDTAKALESIALDLRTQLES